VSNSNSDPATAPAITTRRAIDRQTRVFREEIFGKRSALSVSEGVLHHATCPAAVIPTHDS
jgi:hypothetical protein